METFSKIRTWHLWCAVGVMNIIDMAVTYIGLDNGMVEEKNPLMKWALDTDLFILIKVTLSMLCLFVIYKVKDSRIGFRVSFIPVVAYLFIIGAHVWWIYQWSLT